MKKPEVLSNMTLQAVSGPSSLRSGGPPQLNVNTLDRPVSPLPRKRSSLIAATVLAVAVVMSGCTAGSNPLTDTPANALCCTELGGTSAGLWLGVWHGLIAPVTFFVSLFSSGTSVYEVRNNGGWYNAGFLLGLMTVFGGSGGAYSQQRGAANEDEGEDEDGDEDE